MFDSGVVSFGIYVVHKDRPSDRLNLPGAGINDTRSAGAH